MAGEDGGVDGAQRTDSIAFDAGDHHITADRVAGQAQMMLDAHLCGVFDLIHIQAHQVGDHGRAHGAGCADLGLAAALRAGYGGVVLDEVADQPGHLQPFYQCLALIFQVVIVIIQ